MCYGVGICFVLDRCSFLAGLLGTAATNPIDVVKVGIKILHVDSKIFYIILQSRMMNQSVLLHHTNHSQIYRNTLDCLATVRIIIILHCYGCFSKSY